VSDSLNSIFEGVDIIFENTSNLGLLDISKELKIKIDSFLIQRIADSFQNCFKQIEINQNYYVKYFERMSSIDTIQIQIANNQTNHYITINETEKILKHIQRIVNFGFLVLKVDNFMMLNNLCQYLDECTNILNKFSTIHLLYKFLLGTNYLSRLRIILRKLFDLFKDLKLIDDEKLLILTEFKRVYPNLIYSTFVIYLNETFVNNMKFLPNHEKKIYFYLIMLNQLIQKLRVPCLN